MSNGKASSMDKSP